MVEVYRAVGEAEATIIKGLLEANGIPCFLKSTSGVFAIRGVGEVRVMVDESMAEEAKRLLVRNDNV
jgi:hypothetical protein